MVKSFQFILRRSLSSRSSCSGSPTCFYYRRLIKWEPTEIDSAVGESNLQRRKWSHAAACVPSDISNDRKVKKRVSKEERRAMVESFVNKYRAMNAGKFPTPAIARKEVGGSYYTIRQIVQELEYKSKVHSSSSSPTEGANVSSPKGMVDREVNIDSKKVGLDGLSGPCSDVKHLEANVSLQSFSAVEEIPFKEDLIAQDTDCHFDHDETVKHLVGVQSKSINTLHEASPESDDLNAGENQSGDTDFVALDNDLLNDKGNNKHHVSSEKSIDADEIANGDRFDFDSNINVVIQGETKNVQDLRRPGAENDKQQKASFESQSDFSGPDRVEEQRHRSIDKPSSDNSSCQQIDADTQKKSTLWRNLKSFADGVMSLWKKL